MGSRAGRPARPPHRCPSASGPRRGRRSRRRGRRRADVWGCRLPSARPFRPEVGGASVRHCLRPWPRVSSGASYARGKAPCHCVAAPAGGPASSQADDAPRAPSHRRGLMPLAIAAVSRSRPVRDDVDYHFTFVRFSTLPTAAIAVPPPAEPDAPPRPAPAAPCPGGAPVARPGFGARSRGGSPRHPAGDAASRRS